MALKIEIENVVESRSAKVSSSRSRFKLAQIDLSFTELFEAFHQSSWLIDNCEDHRCLHLTVIRMESISFANDEESSVIIFVIFDSNLDDVKII